MKSHKLLFKFIITLLVSGTALASGPDFPPIDDEKTYEYYMDEEKRIIYIDFESVQVNIQYIVVKNKKGKMIFKEDVSKLPVNSLYELDYTNLKDGEYTVEVHTRTKILSRELHFE